MFKSIVEVILAVLGLYGLSGMAFAVVFHWRGAPRFDHGVAGAGFFFRLLITPGVIALWPLLALKWLRAARGGEFQGQANHPFSAEQIRARHFLGWKLLAVLVPLLVAAALYWRQPNPPASTEPIPAAWVPAN